MDYIDKILLLQTVPGFGSTKIKKFLIDNMSFINDEEYLTYLIKNIVGNDFETLNSKVKAIRETCFKLDVTIIECQNHNIIDTPLLLYIKGDERLLNTDLIGVIGTRNPSDTGIKLGKEYIKQIVQNKLVTISGLARGCDVLAHKYTIKNGGKTIAVLPMGYRPEIAPWILDSGLIISEYPPYSVLEKYKCINRNRIITGFSKGLFLIESLNGGGSEHSLKFAYKGGIPIAYALGFKGISKYAPQKIDNNIEFDLFLKNCIN